MVEDLEDNVYEGYDEESEVKEIRGITDDVSDMTFTNIEYPAIIFKEGVKLQTHKAMAISNMVKSALGSADKDITLYIQNGGELYKMGKISGKQVMSLLDIAPRDSLLAYYNDGSLLAGDKIYVLCSFMF